MADPGFDHFVVGIGASAGGLQAVTQLLTYLPKATPMAFVLVQHLAREHPSELAELLARSSRLPVTWITDHTRLEPGHVYVLPPDREVTIKRRVLTLGHRRTESVVSTVDHFFQSLAADCKDRSIAVILSGTGSDGAEGLRAVKAAGGVTFVQQENTAAFPGMARAAIDSGDVDHVLSPEQMAQELINLARHPAHSEAALAEIPNHPTLGEDAETWVAIFRVLKAQTGVDFTDYKQTTIIRRLVRRMAVKKIEALPDYLKLLLRDPEEVDTLYANLLINVTHFFRDPECFDYLKEHILPGIIAQHAADQSPLRIWVPGCSTGEEAYSLAILVRETLDNIGRTMPVQIFATDLSERAIDRARQGVYSAADLAEVGVERLRRYFSHTPRGFVVEKSLRDSCIFARQNVTKDSPFSRLDLISCRNLLIYLGPGLQKRLMPIFHYALSSNGYLMLGTSESVGAKVDLFRLVDRRFRIYSKKSSSPGRMTFDFSVQPASPESPLSPKPVTMMAAHAQDPIEIMREADRVVLGRYGPSGVLINQALEIIQFRGDVSPYLAPLAGRASLSILTMAVDGLGLELQAAVSEAKKRGVRIRRPTVTVTQGENSREIEVEVTPLDSGRSDERFYLVLFLAREAADLKTRRKSPLVPGRRGQLPEALAQIEQLKQSLQAARNYLQTTIEKHEATNQELRAANEEIQSSNEELQSTNEELETAKEELQSTNEELTTVNDELHSRQGELIQVNNDLHNLINSVHLPILILGQDMRIRRFTPMAEQVLNVIPTDVGRPLSDLNINLSVTDLPRLISEVVESLTIREMEVQDRRGHWYSMRLRPYKTAENKIEGVVMTLIDIDQLKRLIGELEDARLFANGVGEILPDPLVAVNDRLEIRVASQAFHQLFGTTAEKSYGRPLLDTVLPLRNAPGLRKILAETIASADNLVDFPTEITLPVTGKHRLLVSARRTHGPTKSHRSLLISFRPAEAASP